MLSEKGTVFDIQRFSLHDGPGIRTVVFLKGCSLKCAWCHNPESLSTEKQLQYIDAKCTGCGKCVEVCPCKVHSFEDGKHLVDHSRCIACGRCVEVCCYDALKILGEDMTVQEVMEAVIKDKPYYGDDGGLTISGGEPMLHHKFSQALAKAAKENGIHVIVETSGFGVKDSFESIAPYVDIFYFDYKVTNDQEHMKWTGQSNGLILDNLALLGRLNKKVVLRCPIIPGINDDHGHFEAIAKLKEKHRNIISVELMPYHMMGVSKAEQIGNEERTIAYETPSEDLQKGWLSYFRGLGCEAKIG